jgi:ubiquinol-cytochrome c reductase iron-sulfur subunit
LNSRARKLLQTTVRYFLLLGGLAVLYVSLDFLIDIRPSTIQSSYRFEVGALEADEVKILRQDNLSILVVRRSVETIASLESSFEQLQDPDSRDSNQPGYADNALRSRHPRYFVSYAIGTDLGCALEVLEQGVGEVCGSARYDLAGRALKGKNEFSNLSIPDYTFSNNFSTLTIKP